jgi:uncharacterized protein YjbI with pentapeptide repeats
MRSWPNDSTNPRDCRWAPRGRPGSRLRGRSRRLIAVGVIGAVIFSAMTTVGITSTPAYAQTTIDGCTIVAHPTATRFTDCPGANFAGANLSGLNLSFANLSGAQFIKCVDVAPFGCGDVGLLTGADLRNANLSGANLSGVNLANDNMHASNLSSASLALCYFTDNGPMCNVADLTGAKLTDANLASAVTSSCSSLNFGDGVGVVSHCGGASMSGADLAGADLTGDDLSWTVLSDAKLTGSTFTGAVFSECAPSNPDIPACSAANFAGAKVRDVDLSGTQMEGVDFSSADLSGADLSNANLSPFAEDDGLFSSPTNLTDVDLKLADLQGANLNGATLTGARLTSAQMEGANLTSAGLDNATLTHANLTNADMDLAALTGARLRGVTWSNTTCPDGTNSDNDRDTCVNNLG